MVGSLAHARARPNPADGKPAVRRAATALGWIFLLVGVLGFIPGITSGYDAMRFAGHSSDAKLLAVFQVSVLHNIVHLLFGAFGLAMSRTVSGARSYLVAGGAVYLVLWLYGIVVDHHDAANVIPVNRADDWLHFALGIVMVPLGALLTGRAR